MLLCIKCIQKVGFFAGLVEEAFCRPKGSTCSGTLSVDAFLIRALVSEFHRKQIILVFPGSVIYHNVLC